MTPSSARKPPKSTGREVFGAAFAAAFMREAAGAAAFPSRTAAATATAFTAESIAAAYRDFVLPRTADRRGRRGRRRRPQPDAPAHDPGEAARGNRRDHHGCPRRAGPGPGSDCLCRPWPRIPHGEARQPPRGHGGTRAPLSLAPLRCDARIPLYLVEGGFHEEDSRVLLAALAAVPVRRGRRRPRPPRRRCSRSAWTRRPSVWIRTS